LFQLVSELLVAGSSYRPRLREVPMLENLSSRTVAVLLAGLAVASCLVAWGIIIATDRARWYEAGAMQKIHPLRSSLI
jgi:hypothetical protein